LQFQKICSKQSVSTTHIPADPGSGPRPARSTAKRGMEDINPKEDEQWLMSA
jgi:hypothetical protein